MKRTLSVLFTTAMMFSGIANAVEKITFPVNKNPIPQPVEKSDWKGCYQGNHVPVIPEDFYDVAIITADRKKPTLKSVKKTMIQAATEAEWEVQKPVEDGLAGKFLAIKRVRNKHTMTVQVFYDTEKFSIIYLYSTNLAEATCNGKVFLHRNYNVWVNRLKTTMTRSLLAM